MKMIFRVGQYFKVDYFHYIHTDVHQTTDLYKLYLLQSSKILLLPSKCEIIFVTLSQYWTFLYCSQFSYRSSNFAIAKVVALNLFSSIFVSFEDWFMASFLYCFPYSNRSSNSCDSNSCRSFTLSHLRTRKSDNYRYRDSWKSDNFRERAIKKKQRTDTRKDAKRIKSDNLTRGNRKKSNIAIAILENLNDWMAP